MIGSRDMDENFIEFAFLSERKKSIIYSEILEILQYTGVDIHHEQARKILQGAGCKVKDSRVFIPSQLVQKSIREIPPVTTIHHWDKSGKLRIEPYKSYFGPGPTCPYIVDPITGVRRRYLRQDAATVAHVCQLLPEINFVMSLGTIHNVTSGLEEVYEFSEMIQNSSKPIIAWCYSKEHCMDIHEIASIMAGGKDELRHRPIYIFYNEPISPLKCDFNSIEKLIYCAEQGIPQIFAPANTGGATVPATHAAHLVVTLAESLVGVVISQIVNPGACIVIGGTQSILDMRRMVFAYGAPELSILSLGLSEMARYMGLPVFIAGGCSDAKVTDLQSSIEITYSLHSAMLSGADLIHDIGFLESGMTGSLYQLVMADEVISMARVINNGILVNDETLALSEIKQAQSSNRYDNTSYTKKWSRFHWKGNLMDRSGYDDWVAKGSKTMLQRIQEHTVDIINNSKRVKSNISYEVQESINKVLNNTEKRGK